MAAHVLRSICFIQDKIRNDGVSPCVLSTFKVLALCFYSVLMAFTHDVTFVHVCVLKGVYMFTYLYNEYSMSLNVLARKTT